VAEFVDEDVDPKYPVLVNNREADFETLVYENFTIDWTVVGYEPTPSKAPEPETETKEPEPAGPQSTVCLVNVNGQAVELIGKESYIFVDVFDRISFDLNAGNGRAIVTKVNGQEAGFSQNIQNGDKIEIYWKEK
jgi:hypothetical protein